MNDDVPEFSKLCDLLCDDNGVYHFVLRKLPQPDYYRHYHSYALQDQPQDFTICQQEKLVDFHAYSLHQSFNSSLRFLYFIVLKYFIC